MWNFGADALSRINPHVIEDIEDFIILQGFSGMLTQSDIEKRVEYNLAEQRGRSKMHQAKSDAGKVIDET